MTIWFTSDTHFGHNNIIKYSNRPFADIDEMNRALIRTWQKQVAPDDLVFHLGDFAFLPVKRAQSILDQLPGRKHLILGNHDKDGRKLDGWEWVRPYHELHVGKQMIVLCHYAMRIWNKAHRGTWMLYGHSHGSLPDDPNALSFDIGVDSHDYRLLSFEDVGRIMEKKTWKPVDDHGRD